MTVSTTRNILATALVIAGCSGSSSSPTPFEPKPDPVLKLEFTPTTERRLAGENFASDFVIPAGRAWSRAQTSTECWEISVRMRWMSMRTRVSFIWLRSIRAIQCARSASW